MRKQLGRRRARFSKAYIKIQMQKEELYERAQVLQKSRTAEKYLRSSLKTEQECFEQTVLEKQAAGDPLALLCKQ